MRTRIQRNSRTHSAPLHADNSAEMGPHDTGRSWEDNRSPEPTPERPEHRVTGSTYVREVLSGACAAFQEIPAVGAVCKTFLSLENLVFTAKGNKKELAVLLELCDVVTKGALNRWSEVPGPHEGLAALRRHVDQAEGVAAMCNKGVFARFALSRKISRNMVTVKTNIVNFATVHNLALSTALHAKLAKMEAALAAKEKERLEAEERARRSSNAKLEQSKADGLVARSKLPGVIQQLRDWCGARPESAIFKTCARLDVRKPCLFLVGGGVLLAAVCGQRFVRKR